VKAGLLGRTIDKGLADAYARGAERAVDQVIYLAQSPTGGREKLEGTAEFATAARHVLERLQEIILILPRLFDQADDQLKSPR
jgi:hypothetical protein